MHMIIKNVKLMELIQKLWVLSWIHSITDDLIKYKYLCCNKNYQKSFMKTKNKWIVNTYKFSNHDINKIILLLWKGVSHMNILMIGKKSYETSSPEKNTVS